MLYSLERRSTGLAVPTAVYNYMLRNGINYSYDFVNGGLELSETDYNALQANFSGISSESGINHTPQAEKTVKIENTRLNLKRKKRGLF